MLTLFRLQEVQMLTHLSGALLLNSYGLKAKPAFTGTVSPQQ
jgi:hypothetical protein